MVLGPEAAANRNVTSVTLQHSYLQLSRAWQGGQHVSQLDRSRSFDCFRIAYLAPTNLPDCRERAIPRSLVFGEAEKAIFLLHATVAMLLSSSVLLLSFGPYLCFKAHVPQTAVHAAQCTVHCIDCPSPLCCPLARLHGTARSRSTLLSRLTHATGVGACLAAKLLSHPPRLYLSLPCPAKESANARMI
jgi:hypothetical protein